MHFFSRSRQELWHKGETSGNTQAVRALRYDCDGDTLLALAEPAGPACHTGERTCFHTGQLTPAAPHEVLPGLERTIAARAVDPPAGSYTARLLGDAGLIGEKVQEEAEEVARAAGGCCAGPSVTPGIPTPSRPTRWPATVPPASSTPPTRCPRSPAGPWGCSPTTWCAPWSRSGHRTPIRSGCRTSR